MDTQLIYEIIGYIASVLVAVSLMMRSIVRLRWINLAGAITFVVYGVLIGAWPVAAVNGFIVFINIYYLLQMRQTTESFQLLELPADSPFLAHFLAYYADEIKKYFPNFNGQLSSQGLTFLILRDAVPAGVFIGTPSDKNECLSIVVDFVIPSHQDFKIGDFIYQKQKAFFQQRGYTKLSSRHTSDASHVTYLKKMGFTQMGEQYSLSLTN